MSTTFEVLKYQSNVFLVLKREQHKRI